MMSGLLCGDPSDSLSSVQRVHMATKGGEEYRVPARAWMTQLWQMDHSNVNKLSLPEWSIVNLLMHMHNVKSALHPVRGRGVIYGRWVEDNGWMRPFLYNVTMGARDNKGRKCKGGCTSFDSSYWHLFNVLGITWLFICTLFRWEYDFSKICQDLQPDTDRDGWRIFISWCHPQCQGPLFTSLTLSPSLKSTFTILMSGEEKKRKANFWHFLS